MSVRKGRVDKVPHSTESVSTQPGERRFVVFYSWQSDLPDQTNRRLVREALRAASSAVEHEYAATGLVVTIDEATRDLPGSPNIPMAIFEKIRLADAFVADITTINADRLPRARACPNPNVMVELGLAIGHLGWGRIVTLFNTAYGQFPTDVPFDIDRHRMSPFEVDEAAFELSGSRKERARQIAERTRPLFDVVREALLAIIQHSPPKPADSEGLSALADARRRDAKQMEAALTAIHLPSMDRLLERIQIGFIPHDVFHFFEGFNALVSSSLFHVGDREALSAIREFQAAWKRILSFGSFFLPTPRSDEYHFMSSGDLFTSSQRKAWDQLQASQQATENALRRLLALVRERYPEIDLEKTSNAAWAEYAEYSQRTNLRLGPRPTPKTKRPAKRKARRGM